MIKEICPNCGLLLVDNHKCPELDEKQTTKLKTEIDYWMRTFGIDY